MRNRPKYRVEILGPEVTRRRLSLGLDRLQLAERAGISVHRLHKIEAGLAGGVSIGTVQKLCEVFKCAAPEISEVLAKEVAS